jgi:uncharacterized protein
VSNDRSPDEKCPPLPPFTRDTPSRRCLAEDAWNTHDPDRVALAYTRDSRWRNRAEFPTGREEIIAFTPGPWGGAPAIISG